MNVTVTGIITYRCHTFATIMYFSSSELQSFRGVNDVLVLPVWNVVSLSIWFPTFRDAQCTDFHWSEVKEKVLVLQLICTQNLGTRR